MYQVSIMSCLIYPLHIFYQNIIYKIDGIYTGQVSVKMSPIDIIEGVSSSLFASDVQRRLKAALEPLELQVNL